MKGVFNIPGESIVVDIANEAAKNC
jgi:hypothetical protein